MPGKIKGAAFLRTSEYLEQKVGSEKTRQLLESLSAEDQAEISRARLTTERYSFDTLLRWRMQADKMFGKNDLKMVRDIADYSAEMELQGIYRFFISLTSPSFIMNKTARLYSQYMEPGTVTTQWLGEKKCHHDVSNYPDPPEHHETVFLSFIKRGLEISGARNVRCSHPACVLKSGPVCRYLMEWE